MAADFAQARHVIPIHHSTFRLSHEPMHEPIQRFVKAAGDRAAHVVVREVGGVWFEPKNVQ